MSQLIELVSGKQRKRAHRALKDAVKEPEEDTAMSKDTAKGKVEQAGGKIKEGVGKLTDDERQKG